MKLIKSILLGSAAGLVAVAGAQAADLPSKKSAPVEYVRVCSAYGTGFFYIPGTETCLRVGGRARFEFDYRQSRNSRDDSTGFRTTGRLNLDARTQTSYGTLRTFVRFETARRTGAFRSGTQERLGNAFGGTGIDYAGRQQTYVALDKAFIQFAGFTAGRATSFFDFYSNDLNWLALSGSDLGSQNLLAYTATFGSGFSATLSIEDGQERRTPVLGQNAAIGLGGLGGLAGGNVGGVPVVFGGAPLGAFAIDPVERNRAADVVGALRLDQAWGSAQLSGALHPIYTAGAAATPGFTSESEYGYAIQGGLKFNLPMIAAGDVLWLQAAYARGAMSYTTGYNNAQFYAGGLAFANGLSQAQGTGRFAVTTADAIVTNYGSVKLSESFSIVGGFLHYWTPQIRQGIFGSYTSVDYQAAFYTPGTALGRDYKWYTAGSNLIWSPVKDLDIGVEVLYQRVNLSGARVPDLNKANGSLTKSDDQWISRLRVQRDF